MPDPESANPWLPCLNPRPDAGSRLFCFPHAGAGSAVFHDWHLALPDQIEVRPLQLPGRESRLREPPFTEIEPLASAVGDVLQGLLDRPFGFFGYSMGALLAFEVARELRRRGAAMPGRLFVSSNIAPHWPRTHPPIAHLPREQFLDWIRRVYNPPEEAWRVPELMELLLPVLRADMSICDNYAYSDDTPLDCPIDAFGGSQDLGTPSEGLDAWRLQTTAEFSIEVFPQF